MELGGNAPFIVLGDADIDAAIDAALVAKLRHNSETCTAANRFYVAENLVDAFTDALVARFEKLVVGDGADDATDHGPLINQGAVDKVAELVNAATRRRRGAVTGGAPIDGTGSFFAPTVLTNVSPDNPILREEIFGPVAPDRVGARRRRRASSASPTTAKSASPVTCAVATSPVPSASPNDSRSAWSGSTAASSAIRPRPSAASRNPASAARAATKACSPSPKPKLIVTEWTR